MDNDELKEILQKILEELQAIRLQQAPTIEWPPPSNEPTVVMYYAICDGTEFKHGESKV